MKYLIALVTILTSLTSTIGDTQEIPLFMSNAADAFHIDITLLYAICLQESGCRSSAINHSDGTLSDKAAGIVKKSYGMFQLQLATAESLGFVRKEIIHKGKKTKVINHSKDLLKPEVNAYYAAKLLRSLYNRYHDTPKVISAFNAGHATKYNKRYVKSVLSYYIRYKIDKQPFSIIGY